LLLSDDTSFEDWLVGLGLIGRVLGHWTPQGASVGYLDAFEHPLVNVLLVTEADRESVLDCSGVSAQALTDARLPWAASQTSAPAPTEEALELRVPHSANAQAGAPAGLEPDEKRQSIRVETTRVDHLLELVGELLIQHTRLASLSHDLLSRCEAPSGVPELVPLALALNEALQSTVRVSAELQESTMKIRMTSIGTLFNRFPRIVRDLARDCGKLARLELVGAGTELDKTVIEQIGDPLIHLLRNALDHGLEPPEERQALGKPPEGTIVLGALNYFGRWPGD
jgi:two-component system chemotaxis sensor kinase CheA